MNIFNALTLGHSNLKEPAMTAVLAYFLDYKQDHGLHRSFFNEFMTLLVNQVGDDSDFRNFNPDTFDYRVLVEQRYELLEGASSKKTGSVDVELQLTSRESDDLEYRIIIENKITSNAADVDQLSRYFDAVKQHSKLKKFDNVKHVVVFLTPASEAKLLKQEFEGLTRDQLKDDLKTWIFWNDKDNNDSELDGNTSVISLLRSLLEKEQKALIHPIDEYTKHTLKAWITFLESLPGIAKKERSYDGEYTRQFSEARRLNGTDRKLALLVEKILPLNKYHLLSKGSEDQTELSGMNYVHVPSARWSTIHVLLEHDLRLTLDMTTSKNSGVAITLEPGQGGSLLDFQEQLQGIVNITNRGKCASFPGIKRIPYVEALDHIGPYIDKCLDALSEAGIKKVGN